MEKNKNLKFFPAVICRNEIQIADTGFDSIKMFVKIQLENSLLKIWNSEPIPF